jgi:hypothetical protein
MSEPLELDGLKEEVGALVASAPAYMTIGSTEEAGVVSEYLKRVRAVRKDIEVRIGPVRDSAHQTWKGLIALIKEIDEKPAKVEDACRRLLKDWKDKEDERVRAEQRKLDEQARAAAAAEAKAEGDAKLAKAIESGKVAVVSSQVVAPVAKVAGVSQTITYKAEVTNLGALVNAAAVGKAPLEWLLPNEQALNALARATKGTATVPGVVMRKITGVAARG